MIVNKLFKIGEVMEYSGFSRQALHNYTQLGLIKETKRTVSGHRLYGEEVFKQLKEIKRLKDKGKTLLEIKEMLNGRK